MARLGVECGPADEGWILQGVIRMKTLIYNDGREGHRDVRAQVIEETADAMLVQFEDRAEPTVIRKDDDRWMRFVKVEE